MGGELVVTSTEISNTSPTFHNISMNARWTLVDAVYASKNDVTLFGQLLSLDN